MYTKLLLPLLLLLLHLPEAWTQASADSLRYRTDSDLLYRDSEDEAFTAYMKERCRLDVYYPKNAKGFGTVVWFHGGGLSAGERFIPEQLKKQGLAVVAVNYRLDPQVSSPAYIEDAAASVAWVFAHIADYGGDPELIFVSGHSAGGYLASMIGLDKQWLAAFGIDANRIAGLISYSGHTITHFTIRKERGLGWEKPQVDEFAPLWHVRADAPPMVLITGDRELELYGRYEEVAYFMRMMKLVGHEKTWLYELDGYNHGQMAVPAHHILLNHVQDIISEKRRK